MPGPTATTGLRPSIRTTRTSRGAFTSIPTVSTGTATTATTGSQSVQSQNKSQPGSRMRMRPASNHPVMGEARRTTAEGREDLIDTRVNAIGTVVYDWNLVTN